MKKLLLTTAMAFGFVVAAQAQTIVDFTSDTTNQSLRSESGISDTLFSTSTALINPGTSGAPTVYGGTFTDTTTASIKNWKSGSMRWGGDAWRINLNGADYDVAFLFDVSGTSPTLSATDTFTAQIASESSSISGDIRWLVFNDSKLYASAKVSDILAKNDFPDTVSSDLSGLDWFEVTNTGSPGSGVATFAGSATGSATVFDTVSSIGFLVEDHPSGTRLGSFTATAIPEPSTFALLAGVLGLGLVMLRRRR